MNTLRTALNQTNAAAQQANQGALGALFQTFQTVARFSVVGGIVGRQIGALFGSARVGSLVGSAIGIGQGVSSAAASGASAGQIAASAALPIAAVVKEGMSLIADGFKNLLQTAQGFARFAAPGNVERLDRAFEDLYAAVGVMLVPIVDQLAQVLDAFNAAITEAQGDMTPVVEELAQAFGELFRAIAPAIGPTISLIAELQRLLSDTTIPVIQLLASETTNLVRGFRLLAFSLQEFIHDIREGDAASLLSGDWARRAQERANQQGGITIAARAAQMLSTEAIGEQARLAAFGARSVGEQQLQVQQQQLAAQEEANLLLAQWLAAQGMMGGQQIDFQWP
jgi:hypothetical protein